MGHGGTCDEAEECPLTTKKTMNSLLGQENEGGINLKKSPEYLRCSGDVVLTTVIKTARFGLYSSVAQGRGSTRSRGCKAQFNGELMCK
jgi:hypothetical protein